MKISYNWLKDYIDIKLKPSELAHKLTMAGLEVVAAEEKNSDTIFELEVTPNRPDCLSYIGLAREVAAITGTKLKKVLSFNPKVLSKNLQLKAYNLQLKIENKNDCPRYSGRVISGVKIRPSPKWLQDRLTLIGLRPVNNVVDITNFVLMETGQPLHAFDADKLKEEIMIRRAKKGESIISIDAIKRNLDENILIIADKQKPIAIAGIMGGAETEVSQSTKNIFLESACFNPTVVRRGARQLGLFSDSSYRFERGVDLEAILAASNRAASLIVQLCGGQLGQIEDMGAKKNKAKTIILRQDRLNNLLGINLSPQKVKNILNNLELKTLPSTKGAFKIKIPSFRRDLEKEIDLIEEISRIFGYENIPLTLPLGGIGIQELSLVKEDKVKKAECLAKNTLCALGLNEVITYSLIGKDLLAKLNLTNDKVISIQNPLSREQEIMRPALMPSLINAISYNLNHKNNDLKLFELGKVYFYHQKENPTEKLHLSLALAGKNISDWQNKPKNFDFFTLKGIINTLLENLGIKEITWLKQSLPYFNEESAAIAVAGETIGVLGRINEKVLNNFDITSNLYAAELDFEVILKKASLKKHFFATPKYPGIERNLSLIADKDIPTENIEKLIRKTGGNLVTSLRLVDLYFGPPIPAADKGLLYSIEYQTPERTLTDQEVNNLHQKIITALSEELKIRVR